MDERCRVTVLFGTTRVDCSLPATAAVIELLPPLAELCSATGGSTDRAAPVWALAVPGQAPLPFDQTLAELGVLNGTILELRDAHSSVADAPLLSLDPDAAAAEAATQTAFGPPFTAAAREGLCAWSAAGLSILAALLLGLRGPVTAALALVLGAACAGAGVVLLRFLRRRRLVALPLLYAGLVILAIAAGSVLPRSNVGAELTVSAAVAMFGGIALTIVGTFAGVGIAAGCLCLAAAGLVLRAGGTVSQAAAIALIVAVLGITVSARVAATTLRTVATSEDDATNLAQLPVRARRARIVLCALLVGFAVPAAASVWPLALTARPYPVVLVASATLILALAALTFRFAGEVIPVALAGLSGLASAVLGIALAGMRSPGWAAMALLVAAAALVYAAVTPRITRVRRLSSPIHTIRVVLTGAAAALVLGVFGVDAQLAGWIHSLL
jgi:hypothetical protein